MKKRKSFLYYVYCALGQKANSHSNKTADRVAFIRLVITLQVLLTNFFIIAGIIQHWNDNREIPSNLPQTQKEKHIRKTQGSIL